MIEGLRLLPWLQEATRRNPESVAHLNDCTRCKSMFQPQMRQCLGCGFETPVEHATPWAPEGWTGESPKHCVGYTTRLPEVSETSEARFYLKHGSLSVLVRDELTDTLRICIRVLENASNEVTDWVLNKK